MYIIVFENAVKTVQYDFVDDVRYGRMEVLNIASWKVANTDSLVSRSVLSYFWRVLWICTLYALAISSIKFLGILAL